MFFLSIFAILKTYYKINISVFHLLNGDQTEKQISENISSYIFQKRNTRFPLTCQNISNVFLTLVLEEKLDSLLEIQTKIYILSNFSGFFDLKQQKIGIAYLSVMLDIPTSCHFNFINVSDRIYQEVNQLCLYTS